MREALITFRNIHTSEHDEYRLYDMAPHTDSYDLITRAEALLRAQEKDLYHHDSNKCETQCLGP